MPDEPESLEGQSTEQIQALASMSRTLLNDPNTRGEFQRLLKKNNPKLALPEIDTEDRVQAVVKPVVEKIEKLEADKTVTAAQAAANTMFENLRDAGVVKTRKDFAELVKYANEKGFQTNEAGITLAAQHRADEQEPAQPTPQSAASQFFNKDNKDLKDIMKDPSGWARNQASKAIDEIIKNRGRAAA